MPTFFRDEMDARDEIAEGLFTSLYTENPHGDAAALARRAYDAAEVFIEERARRRKADRLAQRVDDDDGANDGGW